MSNVISVRSPYDDAVIGTIPSMSVAEVDAAVAAAKRALHTNPLPLWKRADILDKAAARLAARRDEFAEIIAKEFYDWQFAFPRTRAFFEAYAASKGQSLAAVRKRLEAAQAGLSWATVLNKREGYRRNFAEWDAAKVARFTPKQVEKILLDPGIVRNRLKVESTVNNAQRFLEVQAEFDSFDNYIWRFVDGKPVQNAWTTHKGVPATTPLSDAVSKDLKKRGFKFVGSTVIYAHLQATGIINDHTVDCFRYAEVQRLVKKHRKG